MDKSNTLPLHGVRVLDFGHTVMGPACGMLLGDMGADVIKIEPVEGDRTRRLKGFGTGYFGYFNRNKRSIAVDLKSPEGRAIVVDLVKSADVLVENFAPDTMARLGLDDVSLRAINPRLIYASLKGFLDGPYRERQALDEVVQMMAGLAYMTGPSQRPLRAGTSVVDITGGMFAVIGILLALRERDRTGQGQLVSSALFESTVMLMGQHLCYAAQTNTPIPPMPERVSAWAVYEPFTVQGGQKLFVGITSDGHWARFCKEIGRPDWLDRPEYASNESRIDAREQLIPALAQVLASMTMEQAIAACERARIPFSPINRPEDLFDDPHLAATQGLLDTVLPNGTQVRLPRLPIQMESAAFGLQRHPPRVGQDSQTILRELGVTSEQVTHLIESGVVFAE